MTQNTSILVKSSRISWSWVPIKRHLLPGNPLFSDGDVFCCLSDKQFASDEEPEHQIVQEFTCYLSGCHKTFSSITSYETHYHQRHHNRCTTCGRSFPSNHLLHIHILESHDSMFLVRATQRDSYQCLVESCPLLFPSPNSRKDHLVAVHRYPPGFRFHRTPKPRCDEDSMEVDTQHGVDIGQQTKTKRVFSHKVPNHVTFGLGAPRGFVRRRRSANNGRRHWHQDATPGDHDSRVDIENIDMEDLSSALSVS